MQTVTLRQKREASDPMWVNPILNIIGVNSLRLGGLHIVSVKLLNLKLHFKKHANPVKSKFKYRIMSISCKIEHWECTHIYFTFIDEQLKYC